MKRQLLIIILMFILSGCDPSFSKKDIIFEQDYCGWRIVDDGNYNANFNVNCYHLTIEKNKTRKWVYVTDEFRFKYRVGDTICITKRTIEQ